LPRSAAAFTAEETACWLRVVRSMGMRSPRRLIVHPCQRS
jgi:hypothetical protein